MPFRKRLEKLREELTPDNPIPGVTPEQPPPPPDGKGY